MVALNESESAGAYNDVEEVPIIRRTSRKKPRVVVDDEEEEEADFELTTKLKQMRIAKRARGRTFGSQPW